MCHLDSSEAPQRRHESSNKLPVYFRWGRLRFGFHGIIASLALVCNSAALFSVLSSENASTNTAAKLLIYSSITLNTITALQARHLLDQVPLKTEIVPGIVAPHREAFKRTMSMMHYCNLRVLACVLSVIRHSVPFNIVYILCLAVFILKRFLPRHFDNGNTWIFVVPMCLGTSIDLLQYTCIDMFGTHHYLIVQLSALIIAFVFTLAFRGYFTVFQIYFVSASIVATLFGGGLYVIVGSTLSS